MTHYPPNPYFPDAEPVPIDPSLVRQYLQNSPDISAHIPHRWYFANDEKNLTIAAAYDPVTGWGRTNTNITNELIKMRTRYKDENAEQSDWSVDPAQERVNNCDLMAFPVSYWRYEMAPDNVAALMRKPHTPTKWALAMTTPTEVVNVPSRNIVLLSMWETGHIPDNWVEPLKRVRHLIVPSKHQVEIFRQHYTGDISVIPLGVDPDAFSYRPRPQRSEDEPFTIVVYGSPLSSRKSPLEIVQEVCWLAFSEAMGEPIDNWKLILKTRRGVIGAGGFDMAIHDPHVEIRSGDYTDQELADLCYGADIGIALSKFEGFGLCPLEMMSTGLPVILSENTGHLDFCHPSYNMPVQTRRIIPAQEAYSGNEDWQWNEPDWEQAARELRFQYNLWKQRGRTQSPTGEMAAHYVRENFTWRKTAEKINDLVNALRES